MVGHTTVGCGRWSDIDPSFLLVLLVLLAVVRRCHRAPSLRLLPLLRVLLLALFVITIVRPNQRVSCA